MGMIIVGWIADRLGLSKLVAELIMIGALVISVFIGALTIRQHYINKGWYAHAAKIQKQDNIAVDASKKVEQKTTVCSDANGYWDVITQNCKLEGAE
jgi:predicted glycosyltransferase